MFRGKHGGTWVKLAALVGEWLETKRAPIEYGDEGKRKWMRIEGIMETSVEAIKSHDKVGEVRIENAHNQIHAPSQALATGSTHYADGGFTLDTEGTHAIYSTFSWQGP